MDRQFRFALICPFLLTLCLSVQAAEPSSFNTAHQFRMEQLARGVFAGIRTEPPNLMVQANSVFIINDEDVVVVDTGLTPTYAKELIAELKKLTTKPVSYVVNTHWHDDHIMGNAAFREAYPRAQFVAHQRTREYLPTTGVDNRKKMITGAPPVAQRLRDSVKAGKTLSGGELSSEERASYETSIAMVDRYMQEVPETEVVLPTMTFQDQLVLQRGSRKIELRQLGRSHTAGDIVVYLPQEKIVITGDLVIAPIPLIGSDQSYIADWSSSLRKLLAMDAAIIVPGHGPVMRDKTYVRSLQGLMSAIDEQTRAAVARRESLEQARKSVNLDEFRSKFAGHDPVLNFLFTSYVAGPGVAAAFREASAQQN